MQFSDALVKENLRILNIKADIINLTFVYLFFINFKLFIYKINGTSI